ncbi:hypothetical protein SUGI_0613630 [Cryptomeria japonica]|nr:hypothetical protein SUGI_0613630 [Cryptomeria japonica]
MVSTQGGGQAPPPADPPLDVVVVIVLVIESTTLFDDKVPIGVTMGSITIGDPTTTPLVKEVSANGPKTMVSPVRPVDSIPNSKEFVDNDETTSKATEKDTGLPDGDTLVTSWKIVLVGSLQGGVDPNLVPDSIQTKDGTTIVLPDTVMDQIMINVNKSLVGNLFSLRPTVEMVRKWALTKWKLKGSVIVSAMPGALFLFKFTLEDDVLRSLFGFCTYGKNHLSLCRRKPSFKSTADLHKSTSVWVHLLGFPLEYWDDSTI